MRLRRAGKTVEHPIAVGELLTDDGQPPTVVVAGLLHDVLEDTDVTPAELHTRFGPDIARLVEALTQDTAILNYGERKAALRRQILDAEPRSRDRVARRQGREVAERGAPTERPPDGALPGDARWDRGALRTQSPERTITRAAQALAREITASALGSGARRGSTVASSSSNPELIGPSRRLSTPSGYFSMSRAADVQVWVTSRMNFA
jgi:hypothetical protein